VFTAEMHGTKPLAEPIRVARKIQGRKQQNVFLDDRGFPDQSHDFNVVLHNVTGGPILRKRKHPAPDINNIDPRFASTYDEAFTVNASDGTSILATLTNRSGPQFTHSCKNTDQSSTIKDSLSQ
jgi:hypothetical protein